MSNICPLFKQFDKRSYISTIIAIKKTCPYAQITAILISTNHIRSKTMNTLTAQKEYTKEDIIKAFLSLDANILINLYTNENTIFGHIKENEKVPIKQYLENLGLINIDRFLDDLFLNGHNINNGYVTERDLGERCFDLYKERTDYLLAKIPIHKTYEEENDDNDILHYNLDGMNT